MLKVDVPDVEEPYYGIKKTLQWRMVNKKRKFLKEYLVLWKDYPIKEASYIQSYQFSHRNQLHQYLQENQPQ